MSTHRQRGVTLVELVMVIVLIGIVGSLTLWIITGPVDMYNKQAIRAELTDAAELALRRIARDVRRAVPNSVRVVGAGIEMLNAADGGRYRDGPGPGFGQPTKRLQFNQADAEFNVMGPFSALAGSTSHRLVIYNLGAGGADAWNNDAVITPAGTSITIAPDAGGEQHVTLGAGHQFAFQSPRQRVFLVDEAISYACAGGILWRNSAAFVASAPVATAGVPVTDRVSGCVFEYDAGTATRSGLITMRLSLTADGETVTLLHQVHVDNAP